MKLLFVARAIDNMAGGVEKMITTIMNAMVRRGHDVYLFTWDKNTAKSFYKIDSKVTWIKLDMGDAHLPASTKLKLKRAFKIRQLITNVNPDICICFQDGPFMAMRSYLLGLNIPVIAAERNAPTRFLYTKAKRRKWLTFLMFKFAKRILVQCESYKEGYPVWLRNKIETIPNPVSKVEFGTQNKNEAKSHHTLLAVGRLSYQKNFKVLISAFASLSTNFPNWSLVFIGDGEQRDDLIELVKNYQLENRVSFLGAQKNVNEYYIEASLFCMPSLWEGFPNALAEALSYGLPAVGFADCAGVKDLISHNTNGLLADGINDSNTLAAQLSLLMGDTQLRKRFSKNAVISVDNYSEEKVFRRWENVLRAVVN